MPILVDTRRCLQALAAARPGAATPAPPDVNLVELLAGLMLTPDALHPGTPV
jgi:hypothetical protein